jgi:hypothetical protein
MVHTIRNSTAASIAVQSNIFFLRGAMSAVFCVKKAKASKWRNKQASAR